MYPESGPPSAEAGWAVNVRPIAMTDSDKVATIARLTRFMLRALPSKIVFRRSRSWLGIPLGMAPCLHNRHVRGATEAPDERTRSLPGVPIVPLIAGFRQGANERQ